MALLRVGASLALVALATALLGGCGQKGPLMMPEPTAPAASAASAPR